MDVNAKNERGNMALDMAALFRQTAVVQLLELLSENGADLEAENSMDERDYIMMALGL